MNLRVTALCLFLAALLTHKTALANEDTPTKRPVIKTTAQIGVEYDDNVFKTFQGGEDDGLLRLLLKTSKDFTGDRSRFGLALQVGGKKYFLRKEQDTLIGQLDLRWQQRVAQQSSFGLSTIFKGQVENGSLDSALVDINENFISSNNRASFSYPLIEQVRQTWNAKFVYFAFFGNLGIDFFEEQIGTSLSRPLFGPFKGKIGYNFSVLQFPNSSSGNRDDYEHEINAALSYYGPFLLSTSYAYVDNHSSIGAFSSDGHKVSALFSWAFHSTSATENTDEDVSINLLGTLQVRSFPAIFVSDSEGQRLLFSDGEDNNFNSLTVKITKRLVDSLTLELKFSRYSNEFSDREDPFSRNLVMLGLRSAF